MRADETSVLEWQLRPCWACRIVLTAEYFRDKAPQLWAWAFTIVLLALAIATGSSPGSRMETHEARGIGIHVLRAADSSTLRPSSCSDSRYRTSPRCRLTCRSAAVPVPEPPPAPAADH